METQERMTFGTLPHHRIHRTVEHSLSHLSIPLQISLSTLTTPLTQLVSSKLFLFDSLAFEFESDVDLV
jgi:hypothetical protein